MHFKNVNNIDLYFFVIRSLDPNISQKQIFIPIFDLKKNRKEELLKFMKTPVSEVDFFSIHKVKL